MNYTTISVSYSTWQAIKQADEESEMSKAEIAKLVDAAQEAFAVLDSFVNGQGAVTNEEIEAAHQSLHDALFAA